MNLQILEPGHKLKLRDGAVARVLAETGDGSSIRVTADRLQKRGLSS